MSNVVGLVTARGGSKGVPGKNIRSVGGKPLIAWTIEAALASSTLDRVVVSSDDPEILRIAAEFGAETPFVRPVELAGDRSGHTGVVIHAIEWLRQHGDEPDYIMTLQPTSPFRRPVDIDSAMQLARTRDVKAVMSVKPASEHPMWAKLIDDDGVMRPFIPHGQNGVQRQLLSDCYTINGAIYLNRCRDLEREKVMVPPGTLAYVMSVETSVDIDTPWDLMVADLLMRGQEDVRKAA
ncbi:MAG: acylneuraminate cytidylyltransferase family protein [Pirellulaceae bacterium]|nr:acylneuraminate cytidylyltransferase family protein [Planctomycetaceae bacterium]HIM29391.1 acylneuraminate cytidylyltransferase family protein [Planctomycetota bacterium]